MRVISYQSLRQFIIAHPDSARPLRYWFDLTIDSAWRNFADVRRTFGQTDLAGVSSGNTVAIFDIGGNKYRLIAAISYAKGKVYVLRILTHKEYDKNLWKTQL